MATPRAAAVCLNPLRADRHEVAAARYHRGMKMSRLVLISAGLLVLAACGNKGPLVLPQKPVPVEAQDPLPSPDEPVIDPPDSTQEVPPPQDDGDGTPR